MNPAAKSLRILLVDDHRDTVQLTSLFLIKRGYSVVPAYSMAGARAAAALHECDVLVTDGGLPDGSGVDLMRELKARYGMAAILVSGSVDDGAMVEAEGFKFLAKPINLQNLLDALQLLATSDD